MRITISGPPGSGKTTVCHLLAEDLGLECVIFGQLFRNLAAEKHISLSELGDIAEKDFSIDEMIDQRIVDIAREREDIILESRLAAHMLERNGLPALKVYLDARPRVRAQRIGVREHETEEGAMEDIVDRERSEAKRYEKYYGIDLYDRRMYDLIINTSDITPEEVIEIITSKLEEYTC